MRAGIDDLGRKPRQEPALVVDEQAHPGLEDPGDLRRPLDVDHLIGIDPALAQRLTIARVNRQTLAAAKLADDRVTGYRTAALAVLDRYALGAAQLQRAGTLRSRRRIVGDSGIGAGQCLGNDERQPLAQPDVG